MSFRVKICGAPDVTVGGPLKAGDTTVRVNNISLSADQTAGAIKVFANGAQIGSAAGNGTASLDVPVTALVKGQKITATQRINSAEGCPSSGAVVGSGANSDVLITWV